MTHAHSSLKADYTHDEFIMLSQREPDIDPYDSEYYYRLEMTELGEGTKSYPTFKIGLTHTIDFPSYDSAVDYMKKHSKQLNMYRSRITQYPLFENVDKRGAQWLYDKYGNLIDCAIVQKVGTPEETHFFGRSGNKQRFTHGDIAELVIGDEVLLVFVVNGILTPEQCWEIYKAKGSKYDLDYATDCYTILHNDEGRITYATATALMKPRFPISDEMKVRMERRYIAMIESALDGNNPTLKMVPIKESDYERLRKNTKSYLC